MGGLCHLAPVNLPGPLEDLVIRSGSKSPSRQKLSPFHRARQEMLQVVTFHFWPSLMLVHTAPNHFGDSEGTHIGAVTLGRLESFCQDQVSDSKWAKEKHPMRHKQFWTLLEELKIQAKWLPKEQLIQVFNSRLSGHHVVHLYQFLNVTLPA